MFALPFAGRAVPVSRVFVRRNGVRPISRAGIAHFERTFCMTYAPAGACRCIPPGWNGMITSDPAGNSSAEIIGPRVNGRLERTTKSVALPSIQVWTQMRDAPGDIRSVCERRVQGIRKVSERFAPAIAALRAET